ncbi:aminoglycoside phosphotransferase family protein [Chloroflexi bacterium TSY]|nr:aminoglycoside phosphotransferase family protein [Chloroflexi bacterium TSY]
MTKRVCELTGYSQLTLTEWACRTIYGGTGEGLGIWQIRGIADAQHHSISWSLIVKILDRSLSGDGEATWNYWKREALLYESDLLDELSGHLKAPRCLGVTIQADAQAWIWLEDLGQVPNGSWSLDDYTTAAQHLGEFNGCYLTGKAVPTQTWLSKHWLQKWLDRAPGIERFNELAGHPIVQRLYPAGIQSTLRHIWLQQTEWLNILDKLPHTLCHMDAFPNNLRLYTNDTSQQQTIAFDWAYVGIGAIGEDLAPLVWANLLWAHVDSQVQPGDIELRTSAVLTGYLAGLRQAGWSGDEQTVRLGYTIASLLRYGLGMVPVGLNIAIDPDADEWADNVFGTSFDMMVDYQSGLIREQIKLADELSTLLQ